MMRALQPLKIILINIIFFVIYCKAEDDGKYHPKKYDMYDDGRYYRPLDEGKYVPGDEGKYNYVYINSLYPALPYHHQQGPNGGNGGFGGDGRFGPNGGRNGPNGPDEFDDSNRIQYIGRRIYAERYPYVHKVIKALIDKYVSTNVLFDESLESSSNHYNKIYADKESAVKCHYLKSGKDEQFNKVNDKSNDFVTQYPPRMNLADGENLGSYYSFKGTKVLNSVNNALRNNIKLEYEVFVRIVDEVTK